MIKRCGETISLKLNSSAHLSLGGGQNGGNGHGGGEQVLLHVHGDGLSVGAVQYNSGLMTEVVQRTPFILTRAQNCTAF